jgi:hypothetical protein
MTEKRIYGLFTKSSRLEQPRTEQWNDGKNKNSGMMEDWNNGWWKRDSVISNPNIPFFHDSNIPKKGRAWL